MDKSIFEHESGHLAKTISKVNEAKKSLSSLLNQMGASNLDQLQDLRSGGGETGTDFLMFMQQLHEKNEAFNFKDKYKKLDEFEMLTKDPYFARIDLKVTENSDSDDYEGPLYIGKFGYTEEEPVIVDWRAKVASVYYRYRFPQKNIEYDTPEGPQTKDLTLKRTFEIDNGELLKFYNNDIQLDENEIITDKIEQRTGGVLEDIVETIQEGQLDIIESDPRQICIVQGCVGSGKSTVAIHKLSHIFFNYPKTIRPERSILVAKNQILVGYLSTLFPKLGIFDVNYKTLQDLVVSVVFREKMPITVDLSIDHNVSELDLEFINSLSEDLEKEHRHYSKKITDLYDDPDFSTFSGFVYDRKASIYENLTEAIKDMEDELSMQKEQLKDNPNSVKAWLFKDNIKSLMGLGELMKLL